ncbi:MAG: hypothetical protein HRU69_15095 [Flammeovirgaceae bacterium]|nr:MAG: hypothetical protein HRU69_15095 [Flammeovirgaceae bacterium]
MTARLLFTFLAPFAVLAQSSYAPLNEAYYHGIDRYEIKTGRVLPQVFTSVKPYKRSDIAALVDTIAYLEGFTSTADLFNRDYYNNDNWEWSRPENNASRKPFLKHFYQQQSDFFAVDEPVFDLHVNPVLYVGAGSDSRVNDMLFTNTRGVEVRGMIDKKVGFYSYLTDNQMRLPAYVNEYVADTINSHPVIPHEGFWKTFKENQGYDFLQARGYITFEATRHINLQVGHDRFFIGNGYRSLIFSDFSPPAWFVKGNVKVWKLNYFFSTFQMTGDVRGDTGGLKSVSGGYPQKFTALHHLSINVGKTLNLGFFEAVVFSADDSTGSTPFRLDYLNPVIFYRAIEQQNGSSDNVILGFDFKWNVHPEVQLYGQFVLDEFVLNNIKDGNGWWANKFGIQVGAKYIDAFGIDNLDFQVETNLVRPYTYSHNTLYGSYSHYRQSLGHPLGANFYEGAGIIRYQPFPRLQLVGKLVHTITGRDSTGLNFGGDMLKDNATRNNGTTDKDYGNSVAQGFQNNITFGSLSASWMLKHNLFIDLQLTIRQSRCDLAFYNNNSTITSLALRWNIPQRLYEF